MMQTKLGVIPGLRRTHGNKQSDEECVQVHTLNRPPIGELGAGVWEPARRDGRQCPPVGDADAKQPSRLLTHWLAKMSITDFKSAEHLENNFNIPGS